MVDSEARRLPVIKGQNNTTQNTYHPILSSPPQTMDRFSCPAAVSAAVSQISNATAS